MSDETGPKMGRCYLCPPGEELIEADALGAHLMLTHDVKGVPDAEIIDRTGEDEGRG